MKKGLIIKKEWLDKILSGDKTWEMRSKKTNIRGKIYLIASGTGKIFGECDLIDSLPALTMNEYDEKYKFHQIKNTLVEIKNKYKHPWVLSNVIAYEKPIDYVHHKGAVIWVNL